MIGYCSLAILIALHVVGAVSATRGSLRHRVQTLAPGHVVYLAVSARMAPVSGTFNPTEIAMTLVVGAASLVGIIVGLRWETPTRCHPAHPHFRKPNGSNALKAYANSMGKDILELVDPSRMCS